MQLVKFYLLAVCILNVHLMYVYLISFIFSSSKNYERKQRGVFFDSVFLDNKYTQKTQLSKFKKG